MEVFIHKDDFLKMYSDGIEKEYRGTSIVYKDDLKTLIYYYMPNHKRLYVVDGKKEETSLMNVVEKVRVVCLLKDREVSYFSKYLKPIIKSNKIFYMDDDFFMDVAVVLRSRKHGKSDIVQIFRKNITEQEFYKNGI